jgi:hypothetical protein
MPFDGLDDTTIARILADTRRRRRHPGESRTGGPAPHGQIVAASIDEAAPMMRNFNYPRFNLNPERASATSASNHAGHSNPPA